MVKNRSMVAGLITVVVLQAGVLADAADAGPSSAASWPMFRGGPALLGVAPGALDKELKLLWSFKAGGAVKSSAAVEGGRVFVGSDDGNVYALDFATGRKVWASKTDGPVESSPLVLEIGRASCRERVYSSV